MTPDFDRAKRDGRVSYKVESMLGHMVEIWERKRYDVDVDYSRKKGPIIMERIPPDDVRFCCWMTADDAARWTSREDGMPYPALHDPRNIIGRYLEARAAGLVA